MEELVLCQMFVIVSQGGQEKTAEHVSSQVKYFKIIGSTCTYAHIYVHSMCMMNHDSHTHKELSKSFESL